MLTTSLPILPTSLVGSWPQPSWLIDRDRLDAHLPVRVNASNLWLVDQEHLAEAHRDAIAVAVLEQERLGLDIITDGEVRRESYSNRFATSLDGIDVDRPGQAVDRTGATVAVPRVVGPIRRHSPVEVDVVAQLRRLSDRPLKVTLPGPFTMGQQAQDDFYGDDAELALAYAAAVNEEVLDLFAAGADIVQLDEPYVQARPEAARRHAVAAIDRALQGATGTTVLHVCFGYGRHVADKPTGYDFLAELDACFTPKRSPSRRPNPASIWGFSTTWRPSGCTWACSICGTQRWSRPSGSPAASGPRSSTYRPSGW